jgi:hypothetical protein
MVTHDGETLFNDRQRGIYGRIVTAARRLVGPERRPHPHGPFTGQPGEDAVRWGYLQGYAYSWDSRADALGLKRFILMERRDIPGAWKVVDTHGQEFDVPCHSYRCAVTIRDQSNRNQ